METLTVGVLRQNKAGIWKMPSTFSTLFYVAAQFGFRIFAFSPSDVQMDRRKIMGTFLVNGEKVIQETDYPDVVDNSPLGPEHDELMQYFDRESVLVRYRLDTTKKRTYDRILRDGIYKPLLIPTHNATSPDEVLVKLAEYEGRMILKPLRGSRGGGVMLLELAKAAYRISEKGEAVELDEAALREKLAALFQRRRYVAQPFIHSRTHYDFPFDVRVHARRGAGGKFKVHLFPRVGNPKGVVSNISTGGFSMAIDTFLKMEFPHCWENLKEELLRLGSTFPEYYQGFFDQPLFDVGLDVGISRRPGGYRLHLFEVNTYIDGPFHMLEDATTHFEYYRFLYESARQGKRGKAMF